jgi:hypothetical protein
MLVYLKRICSVIDDLPSNKGENDLEVAAHGVSQLIAATLVTHVEVFTGAHTLPPNAHPTKIYDTGFRS